MYTNLFLTFLRIGLSAFGGNNAVAQAIEAETVGRRKWMTHDDYADMLAAAQTCPGVLAVNISVFVGYRLRKLPGAVCAMLGVALPSFIIMLLVAMLFFKYRDNKVVESVFNGIRPAVVALVAAPVFGMARKARITLTNIWIPGVCALLVYLLGVNPIYVLVAAGFFGYLYGLLIKPTE